MPTSKEEIQDVVVEALTRRINELREKVNELETGERASFADCVCCRDEKDKMIKALRAQLSDGAGL